MELVIPAGLDWFFFTAGFAFVLIVPLAEYLAGDVGARTFLLAGYAGLLLSPVLAIVSNGVSLTFVLSLSVMAWNVCVYSFYASVPKGKVPEREKVSEHCVPKLVYGDEKFYTDHKSSIRTKLTIAFDVQPTDCRLSVKLWASGRAFYGLYFTRKEISINPDVQIYCTKAKNGRCRPLAEIAGTSERQEAPLTVQVKHDIAEKDDEISVRIVMSASVGAAGGAVGLSTLGAGGSIGLPSAGFTFQRNMGTYRWQCQGPSE